MARRVNTPFVIILSLTLAAVVGGMTLFWMTYIGRDPVEFIRKGDAMLAQGQVRPALDYYARALNRQRTNLEFIDKYLHALRIAPVSDHVDARTYLGQLREWTRQAAELRPDDPQRLEALYHLHLELARKLTPQFYDDLYELASNRLSSDPDHVIARKYRGIAQVHRLGAELPLEAQREPYDDLTAALAELPEDAEVQHHLALWHLFEASRFEGLIADPEQAAAQREQAVAISTQMLEQDPDDLDRQLKHLTILLDPQVRRTDEARPWLDRLEARLLESPTPTDAVVRTAEMLIRLDAQSPTEALGRAHRLLSAAVEAHPQNVELHAILGRLFVASDDLDAAIAAFEKVRELGQAAPPIDYLRQREHYLTATVELADLLLTRAARTGDATRDDETIQRVEALVAEAEQAAPEAPGVQLVAGKLAMVKGQIGEASLKFDRANERYNGGNVEAVILSARTHRRLGNWGAAAERLRGALARWPGLTEARIELAEMLINGQQLDEARQHLDILLEQAPEEPQVRHLEARYLTRRGELAEAIERYRELEATGDEAALRSLVRLLVLTGQREAAVALLRQRLDAEPDLAVAIMLLAALTSDDAEREALLARAREAGVDPQAVALLEQRLSGGNASPEAMLEQLVAEREDPIERALLTARLREQAGDLAGARAAIEEATALDPRNEQVIASRFELALRDRDWDLAADLAQQAAEQNLDLANGAFFEARLAAARGRLPEAIAHYRRGLAVRPIFADGWRRLAEVLAAHGDLAAAADAYRRAIEQRPDHVEALLGLAEVQDARGEHRAALETLRTALQQRAGDRRVLQVYLEYEQQHGDVERALALRRRLAELTPNDLDNRRELALLLARQGQTQEAVQVAEALIAEDGRTAANVATLADVHRFSGDVAAGRQVLERYLSERGDEAAVEDWVMLARYHLVSGAGDAALEAYNRARQLEPTDTRPVTRELADLLYERGADAQAVLLYQELHEQFPEDQGLTLRLAETLIRLDRTDEAEALLADVPAGRESLALRGILAYDAGDLDEALRLMGQAIEQGGETATLYYQRARMLLAADRLEAAEADLNEALSDEPDLADARMLLVEVLLRRGESAEAIRELRTLLSRTPRHADARLQLLELYLAERSFTAARGLAQEGATLFPQNAVWPRLLARVAALEGDRQAAVAHWREAVALSPDPGNLAGLATALLTAGGAEEVLSLLREHAAATNAEPVLQALRARALHATGQTEEASRAFALALGACQTPAQLNTVTGQLAATVGQAETLAALEAQNLPVPAVWKAMVQAELEMQLRRYEAAASRLRALAPAMADQDEGLRTRYDQLFALSLYQSGAYEEARQVYERLLAEFPDDVATLNNLAFLLANELGDAEAALPLAERAAALAPEQAQVLDTLGWARYKAGRVQEARQTLERALRIEPLAPSLLHLGVVYSDLGLPDRAHELLKQAVSMAEKSGDELVRAEAARVLAQLEAEGPPSAE